jgi:hypothetical protein
MIAEAQLAPGLVGGNGDASESSGGDGAEGISRPGWRAGWPREQRARSFVRLRPLSEPNGLERQFVCGPSDLGAAEMLAECKQAGCIFGLRHKYRYKRIFFPSASVYGWRRRGDSRPAGWPPHQQARAISAIGRSAGVNNAGGAPACAKTRQEEGHRSGMQMGAAASQRHHRRRQQQPAESTHLHPRERGEEPPFKWARHGRGSGASNPKTTQTEGD